MDASVITSSVRLRTVLARLFCAEYTLYISQGVSDSHETMCGRTYGVCY